MGQGPRAKKVRVASTRLLVCPQSPGAAAQTLALWSTNCTSSCSLWTSSRNPVSGAWRCTTPTPSEADRRSYGAQVHSSAASSSFVALAGYLEHARRKASVGLPRHLCSAATFLLGLLHIRARAYARQVHGCGRGRRVVRADGNLESARARRCGPHCCNDPSSRHRVARYAAHVLQSTRVNKAPL